MKKAAIYSRKSKFTSTGESIDNQIALCIDYCEKKLEIKNFIIYEDEGFSGKNTNRPQLKRMLKDALLKKFDLVICYRLDRISRNVADFSKLINDFEELGIAFISIKEQFDTSTPMGRAMMNIAAVFAQLERETIAERVRDNMLELSKTGRWLGGKTPMGFEIIKEKFIDNKGNEKQLCHLKTNPEEIKIVEIIYDKFLEQKSITKLGRYLFENNIITRNNKKFDNSSLRLILSNPVYTVADEKFYEYCISHKMIVSSEKASFNGKNGVISYNKHKEIKGKKSLLKDTSEWVIALGKHKGVIPSDKWIETQNLLLKNKNTPSRLGTSKHALLTSVLQCAGCGSKMRVATKYRDGKLVSYYYKCIKKEKSKGALCNIPNINGIIADDMVLNEIKDIKITKKITKSFLYSSENTLNRMQLNKLEDVNRTINKYKRSMDGLIDQLIHGSSSTPQQLITEMQIVGQRINELEKNVKDIKLEIGKIELDDPLDKLINDLNFINSKIEEADFNIKKRFINHIIEKILWDGESLNISLKK